MPPVAAAILTEGLRRTFGGLVAVDGVDLAVAEGEIYGFLGPNGAGKSTLVRVLCTLLTPSGGSAQILGHDVATQPDAVRLRIGVALQDASLDPKQTGIELLRLQGRLYGLSRGDVARRVDDVTRLVDIGDAIDRPIGTYSGGMKRRLDLAAALIHEPSVLFLDEPTTGLDPISRAAVWQEVQRLNDALGMTIFLTTQYLEEADALADRVGIIHKGRLVIEGTPTELKHRVGSDLIIAEVSGDAVATADLRALDAVRGVESVEAHGTQVTVRVADGAVAIGAIGMELERAGVALRGLTLRTATLDDVFLHVTGEQFAEEAAA